MRQQIELMVDRQNICTSKKINVLEKKISVDFCAEGAVACLCNIPCLQLMPQVTNYKAQ